MIARFASALLIAVGFTAAGLVPSLAQPTRPVVVELFQSQGCSSCPPANADLNAIADRPDVLALSFGVTYWDQLGWKDTFAKPQFTARQWAYAKGFNRHNVATPELVIDGRKDILGADRQALDAAVKSAARSQAVSLSLVAGKVEIGAGAKPAKAADVWLVRYDPRTVQVSIRRGENGGKTLPHRNIVRELVRLGGWSGQAQSYTAPPPADPALKTAILVQGAGGGPILAAAKG
jgi:hypothetical protein